MKTKSLVIILLVLVSMTNIYGSDEVIKAFLNPDRTELLQPKRVVKALEIEPGMKIVDIGAGAGTFTFAIARELSGTGQVYATEVLGFLEDFIKEKSKKEKLSNIEVVHVESDGFDQFYKKHSFDLIIMFNVFESIRGVEAFLSELPACLSDDGRLCIMYFRQTPDFHPVEFSTFYNVLNTFKSSREDFPLFTRLSAYTSLYVKKWDNTDIPGGMRQKICQDLSEMLSDPSLFYDLLKYHKTTTFHMTLVQEEDRRLAQWLALNLEEQGVFAGSATKLNKLNLSRIKRLNRILIRGAFRNDKLFRILRKDYPNFISKERMIQSVEKAGFKLAKEHSFLDYHDIVEFRKN